jgi:hypothetical protein
MWTNDKWRLAMAVLLTSIAACGDDDNDGGTEPDTEFQALLTGGEEVPPVTTSATGTATLSVQGSEIAYHVEVTDLENAVQSHIHVAPVGQSGDIRLNLCGTEDTPACTTGTGVLVDGTNGNTLDITFDSLLSAIRAGNAYVNVHTDDGVEPPNTGPGDFPGGEIRGQIVPQ